MSSKANKTAVITGGNRGIGEDITHRFLNAGYKVVNISRQEPKFSHEHLETYIADLADRNITQQIADEIVATHEVTTFIHNAGVI